MVLEVLENEEELVEKILAKSDVPREELEKKIEKKQEEYGGLLTRAGAAYSIAKDMGIDLELKAEEVRITPLSELDPDLGRASVRGTVKHVFPVREWEKNGRSGKVASLVLLDGTGEKRVSFWNDSCELLDRVKVGSKVELQNVAVKKRGEATELSYSRGSNLLFKEGAELPEVKENIRKIESLEEGMDDVNCFVRVVRTFPARTFERSDGSEGSVANVVVTDGKETRLVLWDQQSNLAESLGEGEVLKVEGAYVKDNRGSLELNLGWKGRIVREPGNAPKLPKAGVERASISELGDNAYQEIRAVVVKTYPPTLFYFCPNCRKKVEGKCECGGEAKPAMVFNAELDDGTGVVRGVFFREAAEKFLDTKAEDCDNCDANKVLGMEKVFLGQAKRNQRFERDEFIVRGFKDVDLEAEIKALEGN